MNKKTKRNDPAGTKEDKENGSGDKRMGELLLDSQSQKQDEGVRWNGKNTTKDRYMETMEEAKDKASQLRKKHTSGATAAKAIFE